MASCAQKTYHKGALVQADLRHGTGQYIFELISTVPLFLPERLASPTQHSSFLHPTLNGSP
ncbi:hypothetical protein BGW80DRAFT_1366994 [Lactifluus volemus]|nr:hypothetical protein BGW80DRAFT_1366994 [Lactifluus volemus]